MNSMLLDRQSQDGYPDKGTVTPSTDITDLLIFQDQAFLLAVRMLGHASDAEDAVQQSYLHALRFQGTRPIGEAGRGWFLTIVANTARRTRSHPRRRREISGTDLPETARHQDVSPDPSPELRSMVQASIEDLEAKFRTALAARFELGLTYDDASKVLNIPSARLRLHVSRGLTRLRHLLQRRGIVIDESALAGVVAAGFSVHLPPASIRVVQDIADGRLPHAPLWLGAPSLVRAGIIAAGVLSLLFVLGARVTLHHQDEWHQSSGLAALAPPQNPPAAGHHPTPVDAVMDATIRVDYRMDSLRSVAADLSLRVGLRSGVRILHPFPLTRSRTITVAADHDTSVRQLLPGAVDYANAIVVWGSAPAATMTALIHASQDQDPVQREAGIMALADLGDPRAYAAIVASLKDVTPAVVDAAIDGLRRCGAALPYAVDGSQIDAGLAPLITARPSVWRAESMMDILACFPGQREAELRRQLAAGQAPDLTTRAAVATDIQAISTGPRLLTACDQLDAMTVTRALGGGDQPVAPAVTQLCDQLVSAARGAIGLPDVWFDVERCEQVVRLQCLELPEPDRCALALGMAARCGSAQLATTMCQLLSATNPLVRSRAAMGLGYSRSWTAKAPLATLLLHESDREVRRSAIWALGQLRGVSTADVLGALMTDPDERLNLCQSLADSSDPAAQPVLQVMAKAGTPIGMIHSASAAIADARFLPSLYTSFHTAPRCQLQALSVYRGIDDVDSMAVFLKDMRGDTSPDDSWELRAMAVESCMQILPVSQRHELIALLNGCDDARLNPDRPNLPGRGIPRAAAKPMVGLYRWNNGRNSQITIYPTPGMVQEARVVTREFNGQLIVSYLASAFIDEHQVIRINGRSSLLSGPRSADWWVESFSLSVDGSADIMDDGWSHISGHVEVKAADESTSVPPVKRLPDF